MEHETPAQTIRSYIPICPLPTEGSSRPEPSAEPAPAASPVKAPAWGAALDTGTPTIGEALMVRDQESTIPGRGGGHKSTYSRNLLRSGDRGYRFATHERGF